ncbi:RNA polymerase sigma factor [Adhaeribacter radiodurans]|uniref:Sigma-70 family RNA polymerase sigma factor n=1 Tax=Adhaeribacter radiodurans TaxID=2745197 RepID=A0A7L7L9J7_9BACT|nr:sigma-70 family RNA polymerase sigma factor [Adhaeribacter radiodurans]QMU29059.1 sigma-70 family RNA polymerase sigma factor [Adhaeribacter radiodurans]
MQLKANFDHWEEVMKPAGFNNLMDSNALEAANSAGTLTLPNQIQIWVDFKNGDKKALSFIYQATVKSLFNYGQKFIPDKEIVADLIQDLFVELWNQRERLSNTTSIKYFLLKSLRYKIFRYLKRNKDVFIKNGISDDYNFELVFSHEHKLIEDGFAEEQKKKLALALTKLSKRQKEAIYLRYYNNLSYPEIASLMLLSEQSSYNLISKALKVLHKHLLHYAYLFFLIYCFC